MFNNSRAVGGAHHRNGSAASCDAFTSFIATRYFSGLDALRAISVIAILWAHLTGPHSLNLLNHGPNGVDLFFAISGFLVTTLLLREYRQTGAVSLRNFYIRRTLRIFPLYYAVLALYCVLVFLTLQGTAKSAEFWRHFPAFATYTANWFISPDNGAGHGVTFYFAWSLATEEQFYLFWPPLMVALLLKFKRDWTLVIAALTLVVMQLLAAGFGGGPLLLTVIASLAPAILFGAALAVLLNNRSAFAVLYPVIGHKLAAPAVGLAALASLQVDAPVLLTRFLFAAFVGTVCVREDTFLHPLLRWRPAAFIGTISYGIYLMHMLAANVVRKVLGHQQGIDVFLATAALVIVAAYLSFRYFEAPLMRLKSRFETRKAGLVQLTHVDDPLMHAGKRM